MSQPAEYQPARSSPLAGRPTASLTQTILLLSIVLCLAPNKLLPFILPPLLLAFIGLKRGVNVERLIGILAVFLTYFGLHLVLNDEFRQINAVISLFTFSGLYLLLLNFEGARRLVDIDKIQKVMFTTIVLESLFGIVQGLYGYLVVGSFAGDTGDRVGGTVNFSLHSDSSFSNAIFAIIMSSSLILLIPYIVKDKRRIYLSVLPILSVILSSVMHVIVFGFLAVLLSSVLMGRLGVLLKARFLVAAAVLSLTVVFTVGDNLSLVSTYIERAENPALSPRTTMLARVNREMMPVGSASFFVGHGPGQFTSRAGLISSGYYFGGFKNPTPIPYIDTGLSKIQAKYLYDLWYWAANTPWYGSTDMPYFSWLAIYTEEGLVGILLLLVAVAFLVRSSLRHDDPVRKISQLSFLLFLLFVGFSENYYELPQALLPGILMFKLLNARSSAEGEPHPLKRGPGVV